MPTRSDTTNPSGMTKLSSLMDLTLLRQMVEERMVAVKRHPASTLTILDYTAVAQYSHTWNEATRQCRGLMVNGNPLTEDPPVAARPFGKFFNVGEYGAEHLGDLPLEEPFEVFAKMDGSLGVLYTNFDGQPTISTRGSFQSDQAIWATQHYREHFGQPAPEGITLLFEIIYPTNRIVVDYGPTEALVFLAAIDIATGADVEYSWDGPTVKRYDGLSDVAALTKLAAESPKDWENTEGFVLRFHAPGATPSVRAKVKFSEYVRLHRLVTGVSAKTLWEFLQAGEPIDQLLERVPDEFFDWVQRTVARLQDEYRTIENEAAETLKDPRVNREDRKATAFFFAAQPHRAVLFKMLDGQDYASIIWRAIKPEFEKPFRIDADA